MASFSETSALIEDVRRQANPEAPKYAPPLAPINKRTRFLLVICILFMELCERLTFYGVVANLVLYCKDVLKLESPIPTTINMSFQGLCSVNQNGGRGMGGGGGGGGRGGGGEGIGSRG